MVRAAPHLDRLTRRPSPPPGTGRVAGGVLHTRLDYTPHGVAMHAKVADITGDGEVNFNDLMAFLAFFNGALQPGDAGYDPDADLMAQGADSLNFNDFTDYQGRYNAYGSGGPNFNAGWIDNPSDPNGPDNSVGYDGYWFDLAGATEATSTGLYMVRHRVYDPHLGRWLQRDPISFPYSPAIDQMIASWNLSRSDSLVLSQSLPAAIMDWYSYTNSHPATMRDAMGLAPWYEYVPIISTIIHGAQSEYIPGNEPDHYMGCSGKASREKCKRCNWAEQALLIAECEKCVDKQFTKYVIDHVAPGLGADVAEGLTGAAILAIARRMAQEGVEKATLGAITGGVLTVDALLDIGITLRNLNRMQNAAVEAKSKYCTCNK